jgi:predicted transcriptional regulator
LWGISRASAQQVHAALPPTDPLTLSTVQSTLERLVRKGLLQRHKCSRAFIYTPAISRQDLIGRMVAELVSELSHPQGAASVGAVDLARAVDEETLNELEAWVAATREQQAVRCSALND